jgi:hypothetical protein
MKSVETPWTHTGVTVDEATYKVGPSKYDITVPGGTACRKLEGGSPTWVVSDLRFIEDKNGLLYSDSDSYGIRVPEANITGIKPVSSLRQKM